MNQQELSEKINEVHKENIIDVTDFGADPTGVNDSTEAIILAMNEAKKCKGLKMINFPRGEYQIQKSSSSERIIHTSNTNSIDHPNKKIGILIEGQNDLIINGNESFFNIHGDCMALAVIKSENIYLYNFSWDYQVHTTSEITVCDIGTDENGEYTDFNISNEFPFGITDDGLDFVWYGENDPKTNKPYWQEKNHQNAWTLVAVHPDKGIIRRYRNEHGPFNEDRKKIELISEHKIRVYYKGKRPELHQKDLTFVINATPRRETAGAFNWECTNLFIHKVNVHYLHAFGWLTQMSHNVHYDSCDFKRRKNKDAFITSYADSIHVSGASGQIMVQNCYFENALDDPINVHGTYTRVEKRVSENSVELKYIQRQQGGFPQYYVGNKVEFIRRDTLIRDESDSLIYTVTKVVHPGEEENDLKTMTVSFDRPLPEEVFTKHDNEPLYVLENLTYTPSVYIKNNIFQMIPTRGILCTTRKEVVIEENVFKNMAMESIYISNDAKYWYESGLVRNMTIKDNTFYVQKVGNPFWRNAAIRIEPIVLSETKVSNPIHENIKIMNNNFYMEHESVLVADNVKDIQFSSNRIHSYKAPVDYRYNATKFGVEKTDIEKQTSLFELNNCIDVKIHENEFSEGINGTVQIYSTGK